MARLIQLRAQDGLCRPVPLLSFGAVAPSFRVVDLQVQMLITYG
jgi:hypothetical protein